MAGEGSAGMVSLGVAGEEGVGVVSVSVAGTGGAGMVSLRVAGEGGAGVTSLRVAGVGGVAKFLQLEARRHLFCHPGHYPCLWHCFVLTLSQ